MEIRTDLLFVIDVIIVTVCVFCIVKGYINGFFYELINFIFILLSIVLAWFVSPVLSKAYPIFKLNSGNELIDTISSTLNLNTLFNNVLWFVIVVFVLIILSLLLKPLFKKLVKVPVLGFFNRLLGAIFGILNSFIIILLISIFLSLPVIQNAKEVKQKTLLRYTDKVSKVVNNYIVNNIDLDAVGDDLDVDKARRELYDYLLEQGFIDE